MIKKFPNIWNLGVLLDSCDKTSRQLDDGKWVPARPIGGSSIQNRVKAAWLVFTGRADAVIWPEDQDWARGEPPLAEPKRKS